MTAVQQNKYLGTVLDDKLTFDADTDFINQKANQSLFFLRKLRRFKVESVLYLFYLVSFNISGKLSLKNSSQLGETVNVISDNLRYFVSSSTGFLNQCHLACD